MTDASTPDFDLEAFRALVRANRAGPETLAQTRARLDDRARTIPLPTDCECADETVEGVACERLTPLSARQGRVLLYFHGGGYQVGSPRSHRYLAARLAEGAECEALVPDYRKAPFPGAVEDGLAVYRRLLRKHTSAQIVLGGDSAGAGLALALALKIKVEGLTQPAGLVLISPWTDLLHAGDTYAANAEGDTVTLEGLHAFAAAYAGANPLDDPLVSPLYGDLEGLAPIFIQVGGAEMLLSDSTRLAQRAAAAQVDVLLHVLPHLIHGYPVYFRDVPVIRRALAEAGAWVGARLR